MVFSCIRPPTRTRCLPRIWLSRAQYPPIHLFYLSICLFPIGASHVRFRIWGTHIGRSSQIPVQHSETRIVYSHVSRKSSRRSLGCYCVILQEASSTRTWGYTT